MNYEDLATVKAMAEHGGYFVKHLAELCSRADSYNLKKIKKTWPEYWAEYREMAHPRIMIRKEFQ